VHEVKSTKSKDIVLRLFIGWRLTGETEPIRGSVELEDALTTQGVCTIKSGQVPAMWPRLFWTNWRNQLADWSQSTFINQYLEEKVVQTGENAGERRKVVEVHMHSLQAAGLNMYDPYTENERSMHYPRQSWRFEPGDDTRILRLHPRVI